MLGASMGYKDFASGSLTYFKIQGRGAEDMIHEGSHEFHSMGLFGYWNPGQKGSWENPRHLRPDVECHT